MREITFTFPTQDASGICATQTTTASNASLVLNGSFTNISLLNSAAGGYVPSAIFPGIQRSITVTSSGNISTSTFSITGFDLRATGLLTTTFAGPTGAAGGVSVNSTTEFNKVTAVSVGTLATVAFSVGVGATGSSNWVQTDRFQNPFAVSVAVITVTSAPVTIQDTPVDVGGTTAVTATQIFNHATLVTVTANQQSNYSFPVRFTRASFQATGTATGAANVFYIQAGF